MSDWICSDSCECCRALERAREGVSSAVRQIRERIATVEKEKREFLEAVDPADDPITDWDYILSGLHFALRALSEEEDA